MAALRDALTQFVERGVRATRLDQQVLLRGVYFTSGTQEGTPIDRLLGAIGRRFGVAPTPWCRRPDAARRTSSNGCSRR